MSENSCLNCKLASWKKTAAGKLHPSGDGRCKWQFPEIQLPSCTHYIGGGNGVQKPFGGFISRRSPHSDCKTWEPTE